MILIITILKVLDRLLSVFLKVIFITIFPIFKFKKLKSVSHKKKKIFLASNSGYKYPTDKINDKLYKQKWNKGLRSIYLHETFDMGYAVYTGEKKEVYRLCSGIICIVVKKSSFKYFVKLSAFITRLKFIGVCLAINRRQNLCAMETFVTGDKILESIFVNKLTNLPLIIQCQGDYDLSSYEDNINDENYYKIINRIINKIIFQIIFKQALLVLGYNDHCASFTICNGAHPKKVRRLRIHSFISDFESLNSPMPSTQFNDKKIIFICSRLAPEKKLCFAFEAIKNVLIKHKNIIFIVAGTGPLMNELKNTLAECRDQVVFLDWLQRDMIKQYIVRADVNIVPLGGHTLVESAMCEKPVIAFNFEGHTEVISHMESGILVDYPNVNQMEQAILYFINNPEKVSEMGKKFRKRILTLFDDEKVKQREREIFEEFHIQQELLNS